MTLARVDQEHLAGVDRPFVRPIVEMQAPHRNDQRDRDGIAVLGHLLARLQSKSDHTHRAAVRDLLETKGAMRSTCARCSHSCWISCVRAQGLNIDVWR
jgi:hypothetical protein